MDHFYFLLTLFVCTPIFCRLSLYYTDHQKFNKHHSKVNISLREQRSSPWSTWAYLCNWRKKACFFKFKFCIGTPAAGMLYRISPIKQFPKEKAPDQALTAPFLQIFNFTTFHLAEADQGALSVTAGIWQWSWKHRKEPSSGASQHALISF